jgi:uncharacterized protein YerC
VRISDIQLSPNQVAQLDSQVVRVFKELSSLDQVQAFWSDFFTATERVVLAKRLGIAIMLSKGKSYDEIAKALAVSSATISFVAEQLQKKGIRLALRKIADDEWAERLLSRLHF